MVVRPIYKKHPVFPLEEHCQKIKFWNFPSMMCQCSGNTQQGYWPFLSQPESMGPEAWMSVSVVVFMKTLPTDSYVWELEPSGGSGDSDHQLDNLTCWLVHWICCHLATHVCIFLWYHGLQYSSKPWVKINLLSSVQHSDEEVVDTIRVS